MSYLIDTHILLYFLGNSRKLTQEQKDILRNRANLIYVSIVSLWEIGLKKSVGKLEFNCDIEEELKRRGIELLNIVVKDCELISSLPFYHKDPFDRMIISQTINNKLTLITNDKMVHQYF